MKTHIDYLVLSYGRSGSVVLCENLGKAVESRPRYVLTDPMDLQQVPVQHSHLFFCPEQLAQFQVVYNLRKDPVATILSNIMTDHYHKFHKLVDQQLLFDPFEFKKWHMIDGACEFYCNYHSRYSTYLTKSDIVIFYEDLIPALPVNTQTHAPIYPNKQQLILNYDQVLHHVQQQESAMLESQQSFFQHTNTGDFLSMFGQ